MTAIHRTPDKPNRMFTKAVCANDDRLTEIREVWFSLIENHVRICRFGLHQSRNRWGRNRRVQRVTARAFFFDVAGPESAQTRPGAGLFSWLIWPEYTIRDGPIFASNSRASMKIRNQMYAPATESNHYTIPAKIEAS